MSLVDNFITHFAVEVTRYAQGAMNDSTGLWVDGASSTLNVDMSIQPVSQKDRLLLPETVRDLEIIKFYHKISLNITNDRTQVKGDTFIYNGFTYQVFSTADWNTGDYDIKYYKSFAVLVDKGGSGVR
jgi:hypothetical protein